MSVRVSGGGGGGGTGKTPTDCVSAKEINPPRMLSPAGVPRDRYDAANAISKYAVAAPARFFFWGGDICPPFLGHVSSNLTLIIIIIIKFA